MAATSSAVKRYAPDVGGAPSTVLFIFLIAGINLTCVIVDEFSIEDGNAHFARIFYAAKAVNPPAWFFWFMITLGTAGVVSHLVILSHLLTRHYDDGVRRLTDMLSVVLFTANTWFSVAVVAVAEKAVAELSSETGDAAVQTLTQMRTLHLYAIGAAVIMIANQIVCYSRPAENGAKAKTA